MPLVKLGRADVSEANFCQNPLDYLTLDCVSWLEDRTNTSYSEVLHREGEISIKSTNCNRAKQFLFINENSQKISKKSQMDLKFSEKYAVPF